MKLYYKLLLILLVSPLFLFAQKPGSISGIVRSADGKPLEGINIHLSGSTYRTQSDKDGNYILTPAPGKYELISSGIGFDKSKTAVNLHPDQQLVHDIKMKDDANTSLNEVSVKAKSAINEIRESPFNVVAIDTKALYNTTSDLGHALQQASGVKIRETGGVGSNLNITLNGFSGPHVKIFMDGVPMETFSSAFQLNNIPVNVAERIEVYKGVVPIEFGSDAMGGVINIVTNQSANSYVDASYSYGSFNTHKSSINLGHTTKKGMTFQLNAFQNYSDNSYKVLVPILNSTGNYSAPQWVRRFNDTYHNETVIAKFGWVKKPWADRFLVGVVVGQERAEIQNSNIMQIAFGKRERQGHTLAPSLSYAKNNLFGQKLNFSLTANYNRNFNHNIDTAAAQYSYSGERFPKRSIGESVYSLAKFYNNNASANANLTYKLADKHSFVVNDVITSYSRKNVDDAELISTPEDDAARKSMKNILGASYRYQQSDHFNLTAFGKLYTQRVNGSMDTVTTPGAAAAYAQQTRTYNTAGYGFATTYILNDVQLKMSLEKAYRLPSETELFGDEVLEAGNASLRAENSMNYNLGANYNHQINRDHVIYIDASVYYRNINDYIRRQIEARYGTAGYTNHGKVRNVGVDAELRYYYKKSFMVGGNISYQDLRNKERYVSATSTTLSTTYNDRMPNVPYFFGNADAAYYFHNAGGKGNILSLGYSLNFVNQFYLLWESQGAADGKVILPTQTYHDLNLTYALKNGRYNIAFEARNFTDELLYDNYSLQKAGRSFAVKLRYSINKSHTN